MNHNFKHLFRWKKHTFIMLLKILKWIFLSVIIFFLVLITVINTDYAQQKITRALASYLSRKIKSTVEIEHLGFNYLGDVQLDNFIIQDQENQQLIHLQQGVFNIHFLQLIIGKLQVEEFKLIGLDANIHKEENNATSNYDFIIAAFSADNNKVQHDEPSYIKEYQLDYISLQNVHVKYDDFDAGTHFSTSFNRFDITLDEVDIEQQMLHIGLIDVAQLEWLFKESKRTTVSDTSSSVFGNWKLSLDAVEMTQVNGSYTDAVNGMNISNTIGKANAKNIRVDLGLFICQVPHLNIINNELYVVQNTSKPDSNLNANTNEKSSWKLTIDQCDIANNTFSYIDHSVPFDSLVFDPSHFRLDSIATTMSGLEITSLERKGSIEHFACRASSQVQIKKLSGHFFMDSTQLHLYSHHLETGRSNIDYSVLLKFENDFILDTSTLKGTLDVQEVGYFYGLDFLPIEFQKSGLTLDISTNKDQLRIAHASIRDDTYFKGSISGWVTHLSDVNQLMYDLNVQDFTPNPNYIRQLSAALPSTFHTPKFIQFNGSLIGDMQDCKVMLKLNSDVGKVDLKGTLGLQEGKEQFELKVNSNSFSIGKLLGQSEIINKAVIKANIEGNYMQIDRVKGGAELIFDGITFLDNRLKKGVVSLSWKDNALQATSKIAEEYVDFVLHSTVDWSGDLLQTRNVLMIENLSLMPLHLSDKDIQLQASLDVDTEGNSIDDIKIISTIRSGKVLGTTKNYNFTPLNLNVALKEYTSDIRIISPVLNFDFKSYFNIKYVPEVLTKQINHYFNISDSTYLKSIFDSSGMDYSFTLDITNEQFFEDLAISNLQEIKVNQVFGSYNSLNRKMIFHADIPHLKANALDMDSVFIHVESFHDSLIGDLEVGELSISDFIFHRPIIHARAYSDQIDIFTKFFDQESTPIFALNGALKKSGDGIAWHTFEDGLMLNYDRWQVSPTNEIVYVINQSLKINDFKIHHENQSIQAYNATDDGVAIGFNNFTLESFSKLLSEEDQQISGIVNGTIQLGLTEDDFSFFTDLIVKDFSFKNDLIGDVSLKVINNEPDFYESFFTIKGNYAADGNVSYHGKADEVEGRLNFDKIPLSNVEGYTDEMVTDIEGFAHGYVVVNGTLTDLEYNGNIYTTNASFHSVAMNTSYAIENTALIFDDEKIQVDQLIVSDKTGNYAEIDGFVTLTNFVPNKLNLDVSAKNFPVLNTKRKKSRMYYGHLAVNSKIKISGTFDLPIVTADVSFTEGSDLTVVLPNQQIEADDYNQVVEFVNFKDEEVLRTQDEGEKYKSTIKGIELTTTVHVDPGVILNIIVDPISGDYIQLRGKSELLYELARSGDARLKGVYTVEEGHYQMTYNNLIKRRFNIEKGSTMTWIGDPYNAKGNITASYETRASPLPLIQYQIQDDEVANFTKAIPVKINLSIEDYMAEPNLNFNIELPSYQSSSFSEVLSNKIRQLNNDPDEVNKQVFGLLILNRFIPEYPGGGNAIGTNVIGNSARGSVSQLVSDQFNQLAGKYIKAVDINFNIDSKADNTATARTDLEIELSKAIFNDHLIVSIGSDVNLEGDDNQDVMSGIAGDIKVEYLLSEDGKYRLKVYRENEYAGVIDGNLTKTGLSFIFTEEFRTLFGKKEKEVKSEEE